MLNCVTVRLIHTVYNMLENSHIFSVLYWHTRIRIGSDNWLFSRINVRWFIWLTLSLPRWVLHAISI